MHREPWGEKQYGDSPRNRAKGGEGSGQKAGNGDTCNSINNKNLIKQCKAYRGSMKMEKGIYF